MGSHERVENRAKKPSLVVVSSAKNDSREKPLTIYQTVSEGRRSRTLGCPHRAFSGTRDSGSTEGLGYEQFTDLNCKKLQAAGRHQGNRTTPQGTCPLSHAALVGEDHDIGGSMLQR